MGRCAEAYQRGGRWSARRREGFPPGAEHRPKPVARAIYPPVTATVRVSYHGCQYCGHIRGSSTRDRVSSVPGISEDNVKFVGPESDGRVFGRMKVGDNWRRVDPKRSGSERGKQGGQQAALADSGFCHTHGLSQGVTTYCLEAVCDEWQPCPRTYSLPAFYWRTKLPAGSSQTGHQIVTGR